LTNGYQIETIASQHAYPHYIQVRALENGLQITGQVTHHSHKAIRIRGHQNIELLAGNDQQV